MVETTAIASDGARRQFALPRQAWAMPTPGIVGWGGKGNGPANESIVMRHCRVSQQRHLAGYGLSGCGAGRQ